LSKTQSVLLTHGDHVVKVADTFKVIATSNNMIAAIGNDTKKMYGLQFHPEVSNDCDYFKLCKIDYSINLKYYFIF